MKKTGFYVISFLFFTSLFMGCTEEVDESARYVQKEQTAIDYLRKFSDTYSGYLDLLDKVYVSRQSQTTVGQLLSVRGHYTVFAPTNEAINSYLEGLTEKGVIAEPSWDAFEDEAKRDSFQNLIVLNSVIDSGDDVSAYETSSFPSIDGGEFPLESMSGRKLSVKRTRDENGEEVILINGNAPISTRNYDILVTNGVVHQTGKVVTIDRITMADYLNQIVEQETEGYLVMARAAKACGMMDTLMAIRDEVYERLYQENKIHDFNDLNGNGFADSGTAWAPEHRLYGFTLFAEPDDFWQSQGIDPHSPNLLAELQQWILDQHQYSDLDHFTTGTDYESEDNLLYQWLTYHLLPMKLVSDRLVLHHSESGYSYDRPGILGIPMEEIYVTMGKRRLLKIYESVEANGIFLNRFPIRDVTRKGTGHETGCDPDKTGSRVGRDDPRAVITEVENGCIYPIDKPLSYNDEVRTNFQKQRLRYDGMSLFPEAMNNGIRKRTSEGEKSQQVYIPSEKVYKYFDNMWMNEGTNMVYFNAYKFTWPGMLSDEMKGVGRYEVTFRIPPVPRDGIYEIRYAIIATDRRGIAQVYFGDDREKMPAAGIPMDWTIGPEDKRTGWQADTEDEDYNAEIEKRMRTHDFMNGDRSNCEGGVVNKSLRERWNALRRILLRQYMRADKTYYLKLKSVLETDKKEFYMDYFELCPKEVYDSPEKPEDIW